MAVLLHSKIGKRSKGEKSTKGLNALTSLNPHYKGRPPSSLFRQQNICNHLHLSWRQAVYKEIVCFIGNLQHSRSNLIAVFNAINTLWKLLLTLGSGCKPLALLVFCALHPAPWNSVPCILHPGTTMILPVLPAVREWLSLCNME